MTLPQRAVGEGKKAAGGTHGINTFEELFKSLEQYPAICSPVQRESY